MKPLRRLLPYLAPYRVSLTVGLLLVIASSALTSVIPWLLRLAIDALRAGAPTGRIWMLGGAMVGLAVVGGAMRYGMREVIIRDLNRTHTVMVVEHDMHFIRMIADQVTVFHQGRVLAEGHVESILANQTVRDVYLGKKHDA